MWSAALIVFREVLEAALIIGVVLAATRGVAKRGWMVSGGILIGLLSAAILAFLAVSISNLADGMGQEVFSASIMYASVFLLAWHVIWMSSHGKELVQKMNSVGSAVKSGSSSIIVLLPVVALAVMREGAEIVLFLTAVSVDGQILKMLLGAVIGLTGGAILGTLMYLGFIKMRVGKLFAVSNILIMMVAAGMAAKGTGFMIQAGYLPELKSQLWDTSWLIPDSSLVGEFLSAFIGYAARPSGMEVIAYVITIAAMWLGSVSFTSPKLALSAQR